MEHYNKLSDKNTSYDDQRTAYKELKKFLGIKNSVDVSILALRRLFQNYDWNVLYNSYEIAILSLDPNFTETEQRWDVFDQILDEMSRHPYVLRSSKNIPENKSHFYRNALIKINKNT